MTKPNYRLLDSRKFRMLRVKEILERETDASHSITMTQLLELMNSENENDRRTLYEDIRNLEYLGTKIKIDKSKTPPHLNVTDRIFTISELKLIIDAVASSKFLSEHATQEIIDKLKMFCSRYEATELNRQTLLANRKKRIDTDFHDNVSKISKAIDMKTKISFQYFRLNVKNRREYNKRDSVVSPWIMLYANDNYYLMAYDGKIMRNYRVDRIDTVRILKDNPNEGEELYKKIKEELPFRTHASFNLFGGEKTLVTLRCPTHFYYVIADQFGTNLYPIPEKETDTFTVTVPVVVSDQFFGWILSMGQKVTIVDPKDVRDKMIDRMNGIMRTYQE